MLIIRDMAGVLIFSVEWDPKSNPAVDFNMTEYLIFQMKQIILEEEDIEIRTFGVVPFHYEHNTYDGKTLKHNYLIKTKKANFHFKDINLANEYYNKMLYHFFPDITELEIRDHFKI